MAYEQRDNAGQLFKNERREKETHPHATGTAMIDGVMYRISAWTKEGKKGKWQSLSFKREGEAPTKHDDHTAPTVRVSFYDDGGEPF